jgi:hypothetical protein
MEQGLWIPAFAGMTQPSDRTNWRPASQFCARMSSSVVIPAKAGIQDPIVAKRDRMLADDL